MRCPKCDFEQPDSNLECPHCGIIFDRYYQTHYQAKEEEEQEYIRKKSRMVRNAQIIASIVFGTLFVLYLIAQVLLRFITMPGFDFG